MFAKTVKLPIFDFLKLIPKLQPPPQKKIKKNILNLQIILNFFLNKKKISYYIFIYFEYL